MHVFLMLWLPWFATFSTNVDQALSLTQNKEWSAAAAALDRAYADDPILFDANSLHYLRGRVAESQEDWPRASDEFGQIDAQNPLRALAAWHSATAALKLGATERAIQFIDELPADFPATMKMQLARTAPPLVALRIYNGMTTRDARLQRAILRGDTRELWSLIRENNTDDAALQSARRLATLEATAKERLDLGETFIAQRHFADALSQYRYVADDPAYAAEVQFQLARIQFLKQDYLTAIESFKSIAQTFKDTQWQKDAEYQLATTYWRARQYPEAEKAYVDYIARYSGKGIIEGAVRDLADIYRSLGENQKALTLLDRTLARKPTAATRQVLLFTKAKILYTEKRYSAAMEIFRQLGRMKIQSAPGGTSVEEVRYFEALCLIRLGKESTARPILQKLAADPFTYYGQRAAAHLGTPVPTGQSNSSSICESRPDATLDSAIQRLVARSRPVRATIEAKSDAVDELVFMRLWDEASTWIERARRPDAALAADLGYASGRFHRAIAQADKLPGSADVLPLQYPAGYRRLICDSAAQYNADPLWLHAIIWQESKYNPGVQSAASARGLMQFIPDTATAIATAAGVSDLNVDHLFEPDLNIRLGAYYWSTLLAEFKYPELALAAYNGGPDNVRRWQDKAPGTEEEFFVSEIGFVETKRYVQAVFGARAAYGKVN